VIVPVHISPHLLLLTSLVRDDETQYPTPVHQSGNRDMATIVTHIYCHISKVSIFQTIFVLTLLVDCMRNSLIPCHMCSKRNGTHMAGESTSLTSTTLAVRYRKTEICWRQTHTHRKLCDAMHRKPTWRVQRSICQHMYVPVPRLTL
jgi:hypothetical protein